MLKGTLTKRSFPLCNKLLREFWSITLLLSFPLWSWGQQPDTARSTQHLIQEARKRSTQALQVQEAAKIVQEARTLYHLTQQAALLLRKQLYQPTIELLELINRKIDSLRQNYTTVPEAFPIEVQLVEIEGVEDTLLAKEILEEAKKAIEENNLVTARQLLNSLRNEIEVHTHYLPLDPFQKAIKLALTFLQKQNFAAAAAAMDAALNALETRTIIIARPLLEAALMVQDAEQYFRDDPQSAIQLLQAARKKIHLAKALGYLASSTAYQSLLQTVNQLEQKVKQKTAVTEQFQQLESQIQKRQKHELRSKQ